MPCFALELEREAAQLDAFISRGCDAAAAAAAAPGLSGAEYWTDAAAKQPDQQAPSCFQLPLQDGPLAPAPAARHAGDAAAATKVLLQRQPAVRRHPSGCLRRCLPGVQQLGPAQPRPAPAMVPVPAAAPAVAAPAAATGGPAACSFRPGSTVRLCPPAPAAAPPALTGAPSGGSSEATSSSTSTEGPSFGGCGPWEPTPSPFLMDLSEGTGALGLAGGPTCFVRHDLDDPFDFSAGPSPIGSAASSELEGGGGPCAGGAGPAGEGGAAAYEAAQPEAFRARPPAALQVPRAPWWCAGAGDAQDMPALPPGCSIPGRGDPLSLPLSLCPSPISPAPPPAAWRPQRRPLTSLPLRLAAAAAAQRPQGAESPGALLAGAFPPSPGDALPPSERAALRDDGPRGGLRSRLFLACSAVAAAPAPAPAAAAASAAANPAPVQRSGAKRTRRLPVIHVAAAVAAAHSGSDAASGATTATAGDTSDAAESPRAKKRPAARLLTRPPGLGCVECGATSTPVWRSGPKGPKTLCNRCGVRLSKMARRKA